MLPNLVGVLTFIITNAKLYVPIVTLLKEANAKLSILLSEVYKGPIFYWKRLLDQI